MKVICDRGALLDAVNLVAAVVPSRTPSPVLSCVKLVAEKGSSGGTLTLMGSDAETSLQIMMPNVDVSEPGEAVIHADKLRQIVSVEERDPTLTIESDGDHCHIRGAGAHFHVYGYPASDFPAIPDFASAVSSKKGGADFSQEAGALLELVSRTAFATARETSRYAINGVLLHRAGKKLEMVATDGRRLALARGAASGGGSEGETSCIVPGKALNMIQRLVRDPEDVVRIGVTDSRIFFAFSAPGGDESELRAVLSSTLVEGTFPPYEDVIPRDSDKKVIVDREELQSAVRKAAVLTNEESRGVRMSFSGAEKKLTLSSRAPEMGEAEVSIGLAEYQGDDIEVSFNPAFIIDALKVLDDERVSIELKAPNKQGLVKSADGDFVYVVMPVNLPQ